MIIAKILCWLIAIGFGFAPIAYIIAFQRYEEWKWKFMEENRKRDPNFPYPFKD